MSKVPRQNRIPIMFSDNELENIEDWRFSNRIQTRADAVRRLSKAGIVVTNNIDTLEQSFLILGALVDLFHTAPEKDKKAIEHIFVEYSQRENAVSSLSLKNIDELRGKSYNILVELLSKLNQDSKTYNED